MLHNAKKTRLFKIVLLAAVELCLVCLTCLNIISFQGRINLPIFDFVSLSAYICIIKICAIYIINKLLNKTIIVGRD